MSCKIDIVAEKYGLESLDDTLRAAKSDGKSLRELETVVNEAILRNAFRDAGAPLIPGEVANLYQLLTDPEVPDGSQIKAENKCEQEGINPEALTRDFVSYQTVRTHLNECLEIDTSRGQAVSLERERTNVFGTIGRTEQIIQDSIERLDAAEELDIGSVVVSANVRVTCEECDRSYTLDELFEATACACGAEITSHYDENR